MAVVVCVLVPVLFRTRFVSWVPASALSSPAVMPAVRTAINAQRVSVPPPANQTVLGNSVARTMAAVSHARVLVSIQMLYA